MSELGGTVKKSKKQSPSLKARALRLLSMREYSRKSLAAKLEESAARMLKLNSAEEGSEETSPTIPVTVQIEAVLDDFEARGWLSDQRFAEALVRRRSERLSLLRLGSIAQRRQIYSRISKKPNISVPMNYGCVSLVPWQWSKRSGRASTVF
jgi:SOS response regulatory protein OraA/RecX